MTNFTREELTAYLQASEARIGAVAQEVKAEARVMREEYRSAQARSEATAADIRATLEGLRGDRRLTDQRLDSMEKSTGQRLDELRREVRDGSENLEGKARLAGWFFSLFLVIIAGLLIYLLERTDNLKDTVRQAPATFVTPTPPVASPADSL